MKRPIARIRPINPTPEEKKKAKVMEQWINYEFEDNRDFIAVVTQSRVAIEMMFGIDTPSHIWDRIMEAGLKLKMNTLLREPK